MRVLLLIGGLSWLAILSPCFGDSMACGTIIVIAQTKKTVIIAADSRVGETEDGSTTTRTNDCACKLATLGGGTAFGAAGVIGHPEKKWTAVSLAIESVSPEFRGKHIGSAKGDRILESWAKSMLQRLGDFSAQKLQAYAQRNEGHITTGVLAGTQEDGAAWLHAVMINYSPSVGLSYQGYTMTSKDPSTAYYTLGKGEVAKEFEESVVSKRAVAERARWNRMKLNGVAFDRYKTRRLVELTIRLHPDRSAVGGRVDEIETDARGVHWIAQKRNCQSGSVSGPPGFVR